MSLMTAASRPISSCSIRHRQPLVQAIGGDAPRLGREMIDRRERPPREHVAADAGQHHDQRQTEHEDDQDFAKLLLRGALPGPVVRLVALGRVESCCLLLELLAKLVAHGQERGGRVDDQHQRQHDRVPGGEPDADRRADHQRSWLAFAQHEPDAANGVNQAGGAVADRPSCAKPRHLHVDDVVERRRAARLLPDLAREHFARHQVALMPQQVLEQLELARRSARAAGRRGRRAARPGPAPDRPPSVATTSDGRPRRSSARIRASSSGSANGLTR